MQRQALIKGGSHKIGTTNHDANTSTSAPNYDTFLESLFRLVSRLPRTSVEEGKSLANKVQGWVDLPAQQHTAIFVDQPETNKQITRHTNTASRDPYIVSAGFCQAGGYLLPALSATHFHLGCQCVN